MITLADVSKTYNDATVAVDGISFEVKEGELFGLIGTSGCGKTTTLRMINRLEEPTSGSISIDGKPIRQQPPEVLRRGIGYVIQNVGLFPHYSVQENIAITPKLLGWDARRIKKRGEKLLDLVGLQSEKFAERSPGQLSGGQQQRVGLARALAADPPVILMDEPFGALDPITKERIQQEFKKLLKEIKKTIVLVTHDVFEAFNLCDRICLMDAGQARQIGTPRELLFHPADDFVHSFFDNHRFQLEMMSITVGDILGVSNEELGMEKSPPLKGAQGDGLSVNSSDTFFSVFEQINTAGPISIMNKHDKIIGKLSAGDLLEGFQKVRSNLKEDRDG